MNKMNNLVFEMTGSATAICTQDSCEATGPATAICTQDSCEATGPATAICTQDSCEATGPATGNCSQNGCEATAICTQDSCGADVAGSTQQHVKVALGHNQIAPPQYQYTQQSFQSAPAFLC
jgi:hypothetical protein